jgi:hypothetical protein
MTVDDIARSLLLALAERPAAAVAPAAGLDSAQLKQQPQQQEQSARGSGCGSGAGVAIVTLERDTRFPDADPSRVGGLHACKCGDLVLPASTCNEVMY